ncbi:MAG: hypothetical protein E7072_11030, partial [Bacteroidales bacterium]|nr:hypothetical protein [Bacteroidales bacterium]
LQGNVLAVYEHKHAEGESGTFTLAEQHLYGASRIGMTKPNLALNTTTPEAASPTIHYELTNHLGNVMAVITDEPAATETPAVESLADYYPFGMTMPGRSYNASYYRYGFNGFEVNYDFYQGFWDFNGYGYDSRIARRFSMDPIPNDALSQYVVFLNNPISLIDDNGESPISLFVKQTIKVGLKKTAETTINNVVKKRLRAYLSEKWAKQLASDALNAIDMVMSQSWWEYAIELIPYAGDAYSVGKLGKQGYLVYRITQKYESVIELASTAVSKAWKKLNFDEKLVCKFGDSTNKEISKFIDKLNRQGDHLNGMSDLPGYVKEAFGLKTGIKPDGKPYSHTQEVIDAIRGMEKTIKNFEKKLYANDSSFKTDEEKRVAKGILNAAKDQYNTISSFLEQTNKTANNFVDVKNF